jgi:hypothetical protein
MRAVNLSRLLAGALAAALGLLPVAPPEHVHEAEEAGHSHVVVHRHAAQHGILEHHADHGSAPEVDDNDHDGPAFTLTADYVVPASSAAVPVRPQPVSALLEPPKPVVFERVTVDVELLIHGPPRAPTGLRAPPFSPAT